MALYQTGDDAPTGNSFYVLYIGNQGWCEDALFDALKSLTNGSNWDSDGGVDTESAASLFSETFADIALFPDPVGMIIPYVAGGLSLSPQALLCDGSSYATTDYPALFGVIGYTWGGSGASFNVPDLRAKFPVGAGGSIHGTTTNVGDTGGEQAHTLITSEMPSHSHTDSGHVHAESGAISTLINGGLEAPAASATPIPTTTGIGTANIQATGGGGAHENMPPWVGVAYWIVTGRNF